jgi:hypothetical protein
MLIGPAGLRGAMAQLVARLVRNEKVRGSSPLSSTSFVRAERKPGGGVGQQPGHLGRRTSRAAEQRRLPLRSTAQLIKDLNCARPLSWLQSWPRYRRRIASLHRALSRAGLAGSVADAMGRPYRSLGGRSSNVCLRPACSQVHLVEGTARDPVARPPTSGLVATEAAATDAGGRPIVGVPPRADAVGCEEDDESFEARRGLGDRVTVDEHIEFDRYSRDVERLVQLALAGLPGWEGGKHADIVAGP